MRKVIVTEYMTLDGVIEEPEWTAPYWNDEIAAFKQSELFACDALLLGRVTYQGFAAAWPTRTDDGDGFTDRMNRLPKYVASTTLTATEWNATRIEGDMAEAVAALKQQPGQNILVYGSGDLVQTLMRHDLVDEYSLLFYPVVLGGGKRLFREADAIATLKLVDTKTFSTGVVALTYQPARAADVSR